MDDNKGTYMHMDDMSEFFQWFFITSTAIAKDGLTIEEFVNKVVDGGERDEKGELTGNNRFQIFVNGIEVDPYSALSELQKQFDSVVAKKANEIAKDIISEKFSNINLALDNINEIVNQKFNELKKEENE